MTIFILGIVAGSLFVGFSNGLTIVETTRENLRATQILTQKAETLRLLTWVEGTNATFAPQQFVDSYDPNPKDPNHGVIYQGFVVPGPAPATTPAAYRDNLRLVTITVFWTNYLHGAPIVRSRQMQTCVARYGMQNYIYNP